LLETREALETLVAGMAALHRTDEDLTTLEALHLRLLAARGNQEVFLQTNFMWHLAVVAASHNELLVGIVNAISREMFRFTLMDMLGSDEVQAATLQSHKRIMDAIVQRDAAAARRRMARHMKAYIDVIGDVAPSHELEERLLPTKQTSDVLA
jgi:DNA-binding FadR family transcriptional regulator